MYLHHLFRSFLPLHNPIGFGVADFVELAFALLLVGLVTGASWLRPYALRLSGRTASCMLSLAALCIALRLALLATCPVPHPAGSDDFSYLLLGDTISHFRFANPTHPMYRFFEAIFVLQQPTYSSIFPLGQGLALAAGKLLTGSYWTGVLLPIALFPALCYWMLRTWVTSGWALIGGLLAIISFGPLCAWTNSYWGGGVTACAGALVFGALPRFAAGFRVRDSALLGIGFAVHLLTRPFESLFLLLAIIGYFVFFSRELLARRILKPAGIAALPVCIALALTALQNEAVTTSWTTLPYVESRYQYGVPATFTFQPNPVPHRSLTPEQDLDYRAQVAIHDDGHETLSTYLARLAYRVRYLRFFIPAPLFLAALAFLPSLRQPRYLWAAAVILLFLLGTNVYPFFFPHYIAAVTCLFVLISVNGLASLERFAVLIGARSWLSGPRAIAYLLSLCAAAWLFWFGIYLSNNDALLAATSYETWDFINYGDPEGRIAIDLQLARKPGRQLVFVRYSPGHGFHEWIHNTADIDAARVVWAADRGAGENESLMRYYSGRKSWLLQPDLHPPLLTPYAQGSSLFQPVN